MRCTSYCVGEVCDMHALKRVLARKKDCTMCKLYDHDTVLYLSFSGDTEKNHLSKKEIFIFDYGCIVFWGCEQKFQKALLGGLKSFVKNPLSNYIEDHLSYKISKNKEIYIDSETDTIHIYGEDPFVKLSFSYGLSQSVKLITLEDSVDRAIEENSNLPKELSQTGATSLSRRKLAKRIGSLFSERYMVNLSTDLLDTPEFFWKKPRYEVYYEMAITNLELRQRTKVLNDRLNVIHELYSILSSELQHNSSSRLELTIIILILIEVMILILKDILQLI
jgi:uncharacterized Rmd1/YagE family protein